MARIIHKGTLPLPDQVPPSLRAAATAALSVVVREPRPAGFPLLFTADMQLIEPAVAFLHEHSIQRAHSAETVRTYAEILLDWFDTLEQNDIAWSTADAVDLVAYRNHMLSVPSPRTHRPYSIRTINHRVCGVLRFYDWAVRNAWLRSSPLVGRETDFTVRPQRTGGHYGPAGSDREVFVLRQFENLPRPLSGAQVCELMARLMPPYDLIARWQLYTGLRVSELLRLSIEDIDRHGNDSGSHQVPQRRVIEVMCKGRKRGTVMAPGSLIDETDVYRAQYRRAWLNRAARRRRRSSPGALFINDRGTIAKRNTYQGILRDTGRVCGFRATSHQLRATFACMMLARLEVIAAEGAAINPLLIVKCLLHHERIETTDRYLRAVAVDTHTLTDILDSLLPEKS
ncbi:MAG: tyrosine-type recombinase/integrase [Steroidobacteraceae bacterium]